MLRGDAIAIRIPGGNDGTAWSWRVNGIAGGAPGVGAIAVSPQDPSLAYFTPAEGSTADRFLITAVDPNDPARGLRQQLTIEDLLAELVIVPADTTVGVRGQVDFQAGIDVDGIGFIPLRRAIWKVNGFIGGSAELGTITLDGRYTAPPELPDALPATIEIGFSLSPDQTPLKTVDITLADFDVTPDRNLFFQPSFDDPIQLTATLAFSDGTSMTPASADVQWSSSNPAVADVDAGGLVTLADAADVTTVTATHIPLQISGQATVEGRLPTRFYDIILRPLNGVEVEREFSLWTVTRPDGIFRVDPLMRTSRGSFQFGTVPPHFSAIGSDAVDYEIHFGEFDIYDSRTDARPDLAGSVGRLDTYNEVFEFGNVPESFGIRGVYDDGDWSTNVWVGVEYVRLNLRRLRATKTIRKPSIRPTSRNGSAWRRASPARAALSGSSASTKSGFALRAAAVSSSVAPPMSSTTHRHSWAASTAQARPRPSRPGNSSSPPGAPFRSWFRRARSATSPSSSTYRATRASRRSKSPSRSSNRD